MAAMVRPPAAAVQLRTTTTVHWLAVELAALAAVELTERGARRAVMDFWGRLHGFVQLGVPKRGWGSVGRCHPSSEYSNRNGSEMRGAVL